MALGNRRVGQALGAQGRKLRKRVLPASFTRVPINGIGTSMERLRLQGGKASAVRLGRTAVRQLPGSGKAHRLLVRSLLTDPITTDDVIEARAVAEVMVRLWDDTAVSDQFVRVLIAQHRLAVTKPDLIASLTTFLKSFPERRLGSTRRLLNYLVDSGDEELTLRAIEQIADIVPNAQYGQLAHQMLVRTGHSERAENLEGEFTRHDWATDEVLALLTAGRLSASGLAEQGQVLLEALKPQRSLEYSTAYLRSLTLTGQHRRVLKYLDGTQHGVSEVDEALHRFDALLLLGRADEAAAAIRHAAEDDLSNPAVLRRLAIAAADSGTISEWFGERVTAFEEAAVESTQGLDQLTVIYFELGRLDDLISLANRSHLGWRLGTLGRYNVARAHYVRREFQQADRYLRGLDGTIRHWEGRKLSARILLEQAKFSAAIQHRAANPRPGNTLDEVTFFAELHLGNNSEAFAKYLDSNDRSRLSAVFGERAEFGPFEQRAGTRFVIAQNGPGDEIQACGPLAQLATRTGQLSSTCDPRLETLLSRALPNVSFVPVSRMSGTPQHGLLGEESEPRSDSVLYDVLTEGASEIANDSDHVLFSRSLPAISAEPGTAAPYAPSLSPLPERFTTMDARLSSLAAPVGIAWRSEVSEPMRSIHYVRVEDLEPLLCLDRDIVCLQHDATSAERAFLTGVAGDRVHFVDDLDLRNDFETAAALVRCCDAVVGVGTTIVELAGAVGTRTVFLHPNHHGSWRRVADDRDYWHQTARAAVTTDPQIPARCVDEAIRLLEADW